MAADWEPAAGDGEGGAAKINVHPLSPPTKVGGNVQRRAAAPKGPPFFLLLSSFYKHVKPFTLAVLTKLRILVSLAATVFLGPVTLMNQLPDGVSITEAIMR